MLPQVVCCDPARGFVTEISGGAYSRNLSQLDDEVIGKQSSYIGQCALWWL